MKQYYEMSASFSVAVETPDAVIKAAEWMKSMASGTPVTAPEGLTLDVKVTKAPKIVSRKES